MGDLVSCCLLFGISFRRLLALQFQLCRIGYWWQEINHWLVGGHLHVGIVLRPLGHIVDDFAHEALVPFLTGYKIKRGLANVVLSLRLESRCLYHAYLAKENFAKCLSQIHLELGMVEPMAAIASQSRLDVLAVNLLHLINAVH